MKRKWLWFGVLPATMMVIIVASRPAARSETPEFHAGRLQAWADTCNVPLDWRLQYQEELNRYIEYEARGDGNDESRRQDEQGYGYAAELERQKREHPVPPCNQVRVEYAAGPRLHR